MGQPWGAALIPESRLIEVLNVVADPSTRSWRILERYDSGSLVIKVPARRPDYGTSLVKVIVREDAEGRIAAQSIPDLDHVVAQNVRSVDEFTVVEREFLPQILTTPDMLLDWVLEFRRRELDVARVPLRFIKDVSEGLINLHDRGIVHGDLRISRVTGNPYSGFALHGASVPRMSSYRDFRYTAPELIRDVHQRPSVNTDAYAFLNLVLDALRPFRNSAVYPDLARMDARARWLKDYYFAVSDRPTVSALREVLLDNQIPKEARQYDPLFDEALLARSTHADSFPRSLQNIAGYLNRYPETSFAISGESAAVRIHELFMLDAGSHSTYSRESKVNRVTKFNMAHSSGDFVEKFEPVIDKKWMNAIHRSIFGAILDDNHDVRNKDRLYSDEELHKKYEFDECVEFANEVRNALIEENTFFSTAGVINELARAGLRLTRSEIMIVRRWGGLIALPDHDRWIYPRFQFKDGILSPHVASHYDAAYARERVDMNPWNQLTFFSVARQRLGGHALKDVLWAARWREQVESVINGALV